MKSEVPKKSRKQTVPLSSEDHVSQPKRTKRSAAPSNMKEKSIRLSEPSKILESKKEKSVEDELIAVHLTSENDEGRPNRRLADFIFHNSDGIQQPIEMLEVDDLFISGVILPLQDLSDQEKVKGVRCDGFGRIETWSISGYEEGSPVVWVSTEDADYDCIKPATCYKKLYDHFFQKAIVCIEVYKRLSKSSGGSPDISLDELLAGTVRSMSGSKSFSGAASVKEFIISQGEFIYNQLVGLDKTSKKNDLVFADLPVLVALRDERNTYVDFVQAREAPSSGSLVIGSVTKDDKSKVDNSISVSCAADDEDLKYAKLLQEQEHWNSIKMKKKQGPSSNLSKYYIKINEDEIANDYPLPAYYKTRDYETDEYVIFDNDFSVCDTDQLPRSMLHNWSLYNSDMRLISLELLPMKPCADIDVTIFGSGVMTADDGFGFDLDANLNISSSSSGAQDVDGMPVYLSAIKEWMIEFGSSMVFISIRTDLSWYRLGRPSKQYAPWYQPVLKTARLAISIITMLKEQSRVSRLSFADVIKKVSDFEQNHPAYISSNPAPVERYVAVHGQIILQQFAEYPDEQIKKCSFVLGLTKHMEERHHSKWLVKKKKISLSGPNLNPRAAMEPIVSKRKVMQLTTTKFINKMLGDKISNYLPEDSNPGTSCEPKEDEEEDEEQDENANDDDNDNEQSLVLENSVNSCALAVRNNRCSKTSNEILWDGESTGKTNSHGTLYRRAIVCGEMVFVGSAVLIESSDTRELPAIYFVEYMFETLNGSKMFHGRKMRSGIQTILDNAANDRELFLTNDCMDFNLADVKETVVVEIRQMPWGHQHRKENAKADKADKERAEERKRKGLPVEYYCKSLYWPERGAFFTIPFDALGLGSGFCSSCELKETQQGKEEFRLNSSKNGFLFQGTDYLIHDFVYVSSHQFLSEKYEAETFKSGRNIGLKAYAVCQLVDIILPKTKRDAEIESTNIKVRRFFRPEDISAEKAYRSDIREVYYSEETHVLPVRTIEGRCEVRKKNDLSSFNSPGVFEHIFFCERLYDPSKGSLKQLPSQNMIHYSPGVVFDAASSRKKKGKCKEVENDLDSEMDKDISPNRLITLDIFSGCGGLSEGLEQSGATLSKWAIEYEEPAGDAFKLNHPESLVFINNCNVILRAIMEKCGDLDDCISSSKAAEMVASMSEKEKNDLPVPGEVDFITGGPPCQGFSGMNRFSHSEWSKLQCEMIWGFLSFADYFRPKYFLLENVRTFVSFNKGLTFRLSLALLLEMGYQVRFGILEAGAFGVSQSRKRVFIWAASPSETLPEWPEPMHVFCAPELKVTLSKTEQYAAACSTADGAPFRSITVRDTIGDLPAVGNGASNTNLEYQNEAVSWFQRNIRGNSVVLTDHISKEMNELNLIRCKRIPKRAGCDWHELPDEKVKLSSGQLCDLIPFCLPNTAKRHNEWKGLYGRLDWEGNFPTSVTDPQPMGKVGMCFHPDQDRIVTVRECARSQGFPDGYKFCGNIQHKHRQIGNAVPPTLAFALGRKLKEAATRPRD